MSTAITLAVALSSVSVASLGIAWWASRRIAEITEASTGIMRILADVQTQLISAALERDRSQLELRTVTEAYTALRERARTLEEALAEPAHSFGDGLAPDDVLGRLRRRYESRAAAADGASGGALPTDAGSAVPDGETASSSAATPRLSTGKPIV